jgi:RHS repeat-associated protein
VGSLRALSDSSGTVIKQIDYDSFGNVTYDNNTSMTVPSGFAGGLHDRDTGLVRFGFRDYDPAIGRWTAKDPIDFAGGDVNLFGYVQNSPVSLTDPEGKMAPVVGGVILVGGVGTLAAFTVCMDQCMGLPGHCPPNDTSKEWRLKFSRCTRLCATPSILWEYISDPLGSAAKTIGERLSGAHEGH